MAGGFGGAVKLTGESEYKKALQNITQGLKEVSAQMKLTSSEYDKNDKSAQALTARSTDLNNKLKLQEDRVHTLNSQYKAMATQYQDNATKHSNLVNEYNKEKNKLDEIGRTLGTTSKEYQEQNEKVQDLQKAVTKSSNAQEANAKTMSDMRIQIANAQSDVNKTTKAIDELGNEEDEAGKKAKNANEGFTVLKGTLANLASQAITSAINGIKKLGSALIDVGKQAISSYADYEQLVGGVETLFKDSADIVQGYAEQAYKTAGLSANEYMETVTSFSASLLQSLNQDTAKTAEYADKAIIDMSDNANKMGTSMEMIQNAYQGFAKQNYTMLDNLKLGYGGTKTEMERLIKDANKVKKANGEMADLTITRFADVVEAIHIIQSEMGITGTTAKEASETISGSVNSMKSAWKNLLVAIADDNQDLEKRVDEFVDSVVIASENLVPRVKQVVEGIKKLINAIITEVFPKLKKEIPELAPLIDVFQWFIDNRGLVVGAITAMITAFAISKVVSFVNTVKDLASGIGAMVTKMIASTTATTADTTAQVANTTARIAGTTATEGMTVAQGALNTAMSANPIGLVIAGVTALVTVITLLATRTDEATEAHKREMEALEETANKAKEANEAYDGLRQSQQKQIDAGMTEISHYQSLYNELQNLVDENGKVKEGYEQRASFITTTLADALGVEIQYVDGVIKGYGNLKNSIDEVMKKKKAQIILDSQESLYKEAINGQTEALKNLSEAEDKLQSRQTERKDLEELLIQKQKEYDEQYKLSQQLKANNAYQIAEEIKQIKERISVINEETDTIQTEYNERKDLVSKYAYDIGVYEQNMALAHAGEYEKMTNVNWNYVKDYQRAGDAEKAQLQDQIENTKTNLDVLKELKKKSGTDIYNQQIQDNEKLLAEQQEALKQYQITTENGLNGANLKWENGLDNILSKITGANIKFKEDGKGNVTAYADGIKLGEPKTKQEMADVITNTIKEITSKNPSAKKAGENLIEGVRNGVINRDKQNSVFSAISSFGNSILSKLKASLQEKSPSKATNEMGVFLLEGLGNGIDDEENSVFKQITNFGKQVINKFNKSLQGEIQLGAFDDMKSNLNTEMQDITRDIQTTIPRNINTGTNLSAISSDSQNGYDLYSYNSIVQAFQEALSSMKIELDDEEAGKFVRRTVENAIYT